MYLNIISETMRWYSDSLKLAIDSPSICTVLTEQTDDRHGYLTQIYIRITSGR